MVIVSAALLALAFPPFSLWFCAFFAFFFLIRSLQKSSRPVLISLLFGLLAHLIILSWVKSYVGIPPYLVLVVVQALFSLPLGFAAQYRVDLRWYPLIILASEFARSHFPFGGFGWSNPGFTQIDSPFSLLARIGGVYLLATFIIAVTAVRNRYQVILTSLLLLSLFFVSQERVGGEERKISVAAIQGGYIERSSSYYDDIRRVFQRHFALTRQVKEVDLVVWPENVVDGDPGDREFKKYFNKLRGQSLLLGATPMIKGMPENQAILIDKTGEVRDRYTKNALVPFGEYIPFRSIVSRLNSHVGEVNDFRPGNVSKTFSVEKVRIAPIICFEIIDDTVVRKAANSSSLLVLQSNSSTFVGSAQSQQQFAIARMRAIEYGRPLVSAATTGITGFISPDGKVIGHLPQDVPDLIYAKIAPQSGQTFYAMFPYISILFALFFAALGRREVR